MNKKLVGIIVAGAVILLIIIGVSVGKLTLQKDGDEQPRSERVVAKSEPSSNSRQPSSNTASGSSSSNNTQGNPKPSTKTSDSDSKKQVSREDLVKKAVENSSKVSDDSEVTDDSLVLNPSPSKLLDDVYELGGVVQTLELLKSNNGVQSQYKAEIKVDLGGSSFTLDYFTTSGTTGALEEGTKVVIKYQLTEDNTLVIRGISLAD